MAHLLDELLAPHDQARVVEAIRAAERGTSGEIKVHLERRCGGDPYARATALFGTLSLTETPQRNAVLIYLAVADRRFALVGDVGIHEEVGAQFWSEAATQLTAAFARGAFADGLCGAVAALGRRLGQRFPAQPGNRHHLDDELSGAAEVD